MLERTATTLEACNLQYVLRKPSRPAGSRRRLFAGFWQHGASAIELVGRWPTTAKHDLLPSTTTVPPSKHSSLNASAFLLEFLYPKDAHLLVRRLLRTLPTRRPGAQSLWSLDTIGPRAFARLNTSKSTKPFSSPEATPTQSALSAGENSISAVTENPDESNALTCTAEDWPEDETSPASRMDPDDVSDEDTTVGNDAEYQKLPEVDKLAYLIARPHEQRYNEAWDLYTALEPQLAKNLRPSVIEYLSASKMPHWVEKAISLFRDAPEDIRSNDLQAAGVGALMRFGDKMTAKDVFLAGLNKRSNDGGLHHLLADLISAQKWAELKKLWLVYIAQKGEETLANSDTLRALAENLKYVPALGQLYFAFEKYLEEHGQDSSRDLQRKSTSRSALKILRRQLARAALMRPCPPKEAASLLDKWEDVSLYEDYFTLMLERRSERLESKQSMGFLSGVYQKYRLLPNIKPSLPLLHFMFSLNHQKNGALLKDIYNDWINTWGDLDQRGFEQFLTLHAEAGDVASVRKLWKQFVEKFPEMLNEPRGYRSIINVYAQNGDVVGTEREIRAMVEVHGVDADISTWNTLLKAHTRADDLSGVMKCFEQIEAALSPDSFTYAHVMSTVAKRGDFEATIDLFKRSQDQKVPVSKEMAMALTMVYCRNDRLDEAEEVLKQLAGHGVISRRSWNLLLYYYGLRGNLEKCYELLQTMKGLGVDSDSQTFEYLLKALVHVKQVQPAYRLLRDGQKEAQFTPGPEHFAIVLAGAVRTKEFGLLLALQYHMEQLGLPLTFDARVTLLEDAIQRAPRATLTHRMAQDLVQHLEELIPPWQPDDVYDEHSNSGVTRNAVQVKKEIRNIARAITALVGLREIGLAEDIVNVYREALPPESRNEIMPPDIMAALMLGYLRDEEYQAARKLWDQVWEDTLSKARRPDGTGLYPAYEYSLNRPMGVLCELLVVNREGKALHDSVQQLCDAGFKLPSSVWNPIIQALAGLGQWQAAMEWCEKLLMPYWRGWTYPKMPLRQRRMMFNARLLQPTKDTVVSLQKEWLQYRKLAAWDVGVSHMLREVEAKCPGLHGAFLANEDPRLALTWYLPMEENLSSAINEAIRPLSHAELRLLRRRLIRHLKNRNYYRRLQRAGERGASRKQPEGAAAAAAAAKPRAPHHDNDNAQPVLVVTGGSSKEMKTRALDVDGMQQLEKAVQDRLRSEGQPLVDELDEREGGHQR